MSYLKRKAFLSLCVFLFVFSTLFSTKQPVLAQTDGLDLFYTITVDEFSDTIHVELDIQNLTKTSFAIGFFDVPNDIHQFVSNLTVDSGDITAQINYGTQNTWRINLNKVVSSIKIDYDIVKIIPFDGNLPVEPKDVASAVLITDSGGLLSANYFFLTTVDANVNSIMGRFNLPSGWQLVTPYLDQGDYFEVPKITNDIFSDFLQRPQIYFGKMKFYSEETSGNAVIKFGVLEADKAWGTTYFLSSQDDVDLYVQQTALAVAKLTEIFGEGSYPVFANITEFSMNAEETNIYSGGCPQAGLQYWPPNRFDELIGHLQYSWVSPNTGCKALVNTADFISKGLGEFYLGPKIAYDLTGNKAYLGKIYVNYLVYKRAYNTPYMSIHEINDSYYRGSVVGLYLDHTIQLETGNAKSIYDVFGYLYHEYKNKGLVTNDKAALEEAVNAVTGTDHSEIFDRYIYGNEEIPVEDFIQPYQDAFPEFLQTLESDNWMNRNYQGYAIPFFVDIEMSIPLSSHIPAGLLIDRYYEQFADEMITNYEIDSITKEDVESTLSRLTGGNSSGFFERWSDSYGELSLEDMKNWLTDYSENPQGQSNSSSSLSDMAITLDGNAVDWPEISPLLVDSEDSNENVFNSLYGFSDESYLYLRIDPHDMLISDNPIRLVIDIYTDGDLPSTWQLSTDITDSENIYLCSMVSNQPDFESMRRYPGLGIDQVIEVAIPLDYIGDPNKVTLRVYASNNADIDFNSVSYTIDTELITKITPTLQTPNQYLTPTISPLAQYPNSSYSFPWWLVVTLLGLGSIIGVLILTAKKSISK